jgi:hypothetical protein
MRDLERRDTDLIFAQLEAYGWLKRQTGKWFTEVIWNVNPKVHQLFKSEYLAARRKIEAIKQRLALVMNSSCKPRDDE